METNKSQDPRKKFQEDLATQLIESRAPWEILRTTGFELPYNAANGSAFHLYNAMKLMVAAEDRGYQDPRWMTYDDAQKAGYQVTRRGAVMIEKYERTQWVPETDQKTGEPVLDEKGQQKYVQIPLESQRLVPVWLFNAAQIDGMPTHEPKGQAYNPERIENLLRSSKAAFLSGAEKAHYSPQHDTINLLPLNSYSARGAMHMAALRGLGQWTASTRRLNLTSSEPVGTMGHARDQIRNEIFAMAAAAEYGLPHVPKAPMVSDAMVKAMKNNPSELLNLTSEATAILNRIRTFDREYDMNQAKAIRPRQPARIIPKSLQVFKTEHLEPAEELKAFAGDMGVVIGGNPILDGQEQKAISPIGLTTGFYQGEPGRPVTVQNPFTGEKGEWIEKGYHLGREKKAELSDAIDTARKERDLEEQNRYEQSRTRCVQTLVAATVLNPDSTVLPEFLSERKLKAHGLRVVGEDLLLPARDLQGKTWSYQTIHPTGERSFPADSKTLGCMAVIGGKQEDLVNEKVLLIAESYESAAALHDVSKRPVIIAFSANNMKVVAEEIHAKNPEIQITFFSDRSTKIQNTGRDIILNQDFEKLNAKHVKPIGSARTFNDVLQKLDRDTLKSLVDASIFLKELKMSGKERSVSRTKTIDTGISR